ncbi:protein-disulfide reductase DsbD domain-containing protein [Brucella sp. BE17]|uniref:protein-disulfide reductase DsbD domain-containing protein n=1 Tax=Brucella sp. BE17 TaxID=3142977 RepID=UPI0031BAB874
MNIRTLLLFSLVFAVTALPAAASTSPWTQTPGGRVRVIIEDQASDNGAIRGALQIDLAPGWKTYWRNPGSSGVPPQITLEGRADAQIAYPAPVLFSAAEDGIGYKRPVSLPITFKPDPDGHRLKGNVFLGVCEKICIPVQTEFDFSLEEADAVQSSAPQQVAVRTIIETAFDRLPAPASKDFGITKVKREGDKAIFKLALPDPHAPAQLFVASDKMSLSQPVASPAQDDPEFIVTLHGKAKAVIVDYTIVQNGEAVSGQVALD